MIRIVALLVIWPIGAVAAFYAVDGALNAARSRLVPKNVGTVRVGVLYRSGQMRPEHYRSVLEEHGIRTVVCLNPDEDNAFEPEIASGLGVEYRTFDMPGSGIGTAEQFHEILDLLEQPHRRPVLVHCAAGAYRTGATVALYRMLFEGWSRDDAVAEMKSYGFAGQQDLIDHVTSVYETIPPDLRQRWNARHRAKLADASEDGDVR